MGITGFRHTQETKDKLSVLRRGSANPFYGKSHTDAHKLAVGARTREFNRTRVYPLAARTVPELSDTQAAYLAGIIDGEGTIALSPGGRRGVRLSVGNTHVGVIAWLEWAFASRSTTSASRVARVPCHVVTCARAADAAAILIRIRPFLIIKTDAADVALAALKESYGERLSWA